MYTLFENFALCDENKQPYSFSAEKHTFVDNLHAWVEDETFKMSSIGNVYILNTPRVQCGRFNMRYLITYMTEIEPRFTVYFSYNEKTREGMGIQYNYDLKNTLKISLVKIHGSNRIVHETKSADIAVLQTDTYYDFELTTEKDKIFVSAAGRNFEFDFSPDKGKFAIERANFIGELIIDYVRFESNDTFSSEVVVDEIKAEIPLTNGGDIPYTFSWDIKRIEDDFFLTCKLDGGTRTRKIDRGDRPGQYVAEKDFMLNPYAAIGSKDGRYFRFFMGNGEKAFIDPNIYWECQKEFLNDTELPLINTYKIPADSISDDIEFIFGYDNLFCTGYATQEGGREFRFSSDGRLIYNGDAMDGRDVFELRSNPDKYALRFVPDDCYDKETVMEHIKSNHYFEINESIDFTFVMKTRREAEYLSFKTNILDVYESKVISSAEPEIEIKPCDYKYKEINLRASFGKLAIGVFKAELQVFFGDKLLKKYIKVFEVFDENSSVNPAIASGLPFTFTMPNEQKRLMRNGFDLWTPMPSCDLVHYYNCITDTPVEAQQRKPWKMLKKFKREWFAWISSRTCKDWDISKYYDVVKNCDYLFSSINEEVLDLSQSSLYPIRQDHHLYYNFLMRKKQRIKILEDFLKDNPEIAEKVKYKIGMEEFTFEHFSDLMKVAFKEWIEYQNKAGLTIIKNNNDEIRKINPKVKRAVYGPLNQYISPALSYHSLKVYGQSDMNALSNDVFTGFAIFEDYPYSCSYQTYRGAFFVMTLLLNSPNLTLYPEQYGSSKGGCIDGAVKFAHAPMGAYEIEAYQLSTQAYEYVFNTAYRLEDGFHYWNTYGFHRSPNLLSGLVCDWKNVLDNKPEKPMKTIAFLTDYSDNEDIVRIIDFDGENQCCNIVNQSESAHGYIFECSRDAGIPNGFAVKFDTLKHMDAKECDLLVLPDLKYESKENIEEIRRLYNEGVNLLAVSDVSGLEDLFGVEKNEHTSVINSVIYCDEEEFVKENEATITYSPKNTEVVLSSSAGEPLIMAGKRTAIINTTINYMGESDSKYMCYAKTTHIVGELVKKALMCVLRKISDPLVIGENVGVTLFEAKDGRKILLAIDYTKFDNAEHNKKTAVIKINMNNIIGAKSKRDLLMCRDNNIIKEIRFKIKPHESVFIELESEVLV